MSGWGDLEAVLMTVRHGGLSPAARVLGVSHVTVARRIAQAEERLGALLFNRLPQGYVATAAGRSAARTAEAMEAAAAELDLAIAGRDSTLAGDLVLTAPPVLVAPVLADLLAGFAARHPQIRLKLLATNDTLNLHRREADIAIRVSRSPAETLWGVQATEQRAGFYISARSFAERGPTGVAWVGFSHWPGVPEAVSQVYGAVAEAVVFDDMVAVLGAVQAGLGAARMPCCIGDGTPGLIRLPETPLEDYAPIWLLAHREMRNVPRLQAFMAFAAAELRARRGLFCGAA